MKKQHWGSMLVTVSAVVLFAAGSTFAAATPKLGVFDAVSVLQMSQWGKQASEEMKKQAGKLEADVEQKQKAFAAKKEEFDKKQSVLDAKTKAQKEQELRDMAQEGQKLLMDSKGKLNELENALLKQVRTVVEKVAKDEKFDFVFEKSSLAYSSDKEDITRRVAAELDKLPPFRP